MWVGWVCPGADYNQVGPGQKTFFAQESQVMTFSLSLTNSHRKTKLKQEGSHID